MQAKIILVFLICCVTMQLRSSGCVTDDERILMGEPVIFVNDIVFGEIPIGVHIAKDYQIMNEGTVELTITGYKGPNLKEFVNDLTKPSILKPLLIASGKGMNFRNVTVYFAPNTEGEFTDTITYISDAGLNRKNYCRIHGIGVKSTEVENNKENIITEARIIYDRNTCMLNYSVAGYSNVNIDIYNSLGVKQKNITNERKEAGNYYLQISTDGLVTGIYYIEIKIDNKPYILKLILNK